MFSRELKKGSTELLILSLLETGPRRIGGFPCRPERKPARVGSDRIT